MKWFTGCKKALLDTPVPSSPFSVNHIVTLTLSPFSGGSNQPLLETPSQCGLLVSLCLLALAWLLSVSSHFSLCVIVLPSIGCEKHCVIIRDGWKINLGDVNQGWQVESIIRSIIVKTKTLPAITWHKRKMTERIPEESRKPHTWNHGQREKVFPWPRQDDDYWQKALISVI